MKRSLICILIIFLLSCICGCQDGWDTSSSLNGMAADYSQVRETMWREGGALSLSPEILESYLSSTPIILPENSIFTSAQFFDIQGNAIDGSGQSLRDSVPYQRLMGHLDYYTYLEEIEGTAHQSIIIKMWDPDPIMIPLKFIGILKLSAPLSQVFNTDYPTDNIIIMDSSKNIIDFDSARVITDLEEDPVLTGFIKDISLLNEKEGTEEIVQSDLSGRYQYKITDGFVIAKKIH